MDKWDLITDKYDELPGVVKDAFSAEGMRKLLLELMQKEKLHVDQIGLLEEEVMLLVVGEQHADAFEQQVIQRLKITPEQARKIFDTVNEDVLEPMRQALRQHDQEFKNAAEDEAVETMPAAVGQLEATEIGVLQYDLPRKKTTVTEEAAPIIPQAETDTPQVPAAAGAQPPIASPTGAATAPLTQAKLETAVRLPKTLNETTETSPDMPPKKLYPGGADPYHEPVEP